MDLKAFSATLFSSLFVSVAAFAGNVEWYASTPDAQWVKQNVKIDKSAVDAGIVLDNAPVKQTVKGIGGCFNEMGWDALQSLSADDRNAVMKALFGPEGAAFDYCRLPLGANDFSLSYYSMDDVAEDFNLVNFNIDRDRYLLIPYIRAAREVNPDLKIWASPWCPPAWMKTNRHYASSVVGWGDDTNGLLSHQANADNSTAFTMTDRYLRTYAQYFLKFAKAYAAEGLPLDCIHVQNEPCSNQVFPSCKWRPEDLTYFFGKFLGPAFEEAGMDTKLYYGTINTSDPEYVRTALRDPDASKYLSGVGFQWDGKNSIPVIHSENPDLDLMQTESECGNGENTWDYAEYTWNLIKHYFTNGVSSYNYWNMILASPSISPWGWRQNSMVLVDRENGTYSFTPEFYVMKHLGHYVHAGAQLLETPADANILAFRNPDNSVAVLLSNPTDQSSTTTVTVGGKTLPVKMAPHSFNTVLFN